RDAEALRRVAHIERQFAELLVSPAWEPHTPTLRYGTFSSQFSGSGATLWTVVNRNEYALTGRQLDVPYAAATHYYDLWHGVPVEPESHGQRAVLSFDMEPHGFGAILANSGTPDATLEKFLAQSRELTRT